jgi:surface antigen
MRIATVAAFAGVLLLCACRGETGIVTGAIPGANTGHVIGSPVATGEGDAEVGAVEGGLTGADVGRSLSEAERKLALKAEYEALEYGRSGQPTEWRNRSGSVTGKIEVGTIYRVNRLDCREYTHNIAIGGRTRVVKGTACRQPDGVWRILG